MKKLFTLLFVSALAISFNACSGDDDGDNGGGGNNADSIVGTWKYYGDSMDGVISPDDIEACDDEIYQFSKDGKLKVTEKYCGEPSFVYTVDWVKTSAGVYEFSYENQVIEAYLIKFSEDGKYAFLYESQEDFDENGYADVWKKS